jgi:hypothetical protein
MICINAVTLLNCDHDRREHILAPRITGKEYCPSEAYACGGGGAIAAALAAFNPASNAAACDEPLSYWDETRNQALKVIGH